MTLCRKLTVYKGFNPGVAACLIYIQDGGFDVAFVEFAPEIILLYHIRDVQMT